MTNPHSHATTHPAPGATPDKPSYDDINTSLIAMVGIISGIVTYISVVVVQGLTYQMDMNMIRQRSHGTQFVESIEAIDAQREMLLANPTTNRPSIDEAMAETVAKFNTKNP